LEIARQLEKLGVDVIEAGFPATSPGDFEAVRRITQEVSVPVIAALARALPFDIKQAGEALKKAKKGRVHTFIGTSPIHMKYQLNKSPQQVLQLARKAVKLAREYTSKVEFSPMDATRSDFVFLCEVIESGIKGKSMRARIRRVSRRL